MKKVLLLVILIAAFGAFLPSAQATTLVYDLDTEFSGATSPSGSTPWLTATFDDDDTLGSVRLTMSASGLQYNEKVGDWDFNLDPSLDPTDLTFSWFSGYTPTVSTSVDAFKADGDGYFDIKFDFSTNWGATSGTPDADVVVDIGGISSLSALSFNFGSVSGSKGSLLTAAHVQRIGLTGDPSGWITGDVSPVPEPATVLLLGTGLLGIGVFGRKKFKK